MRWDADRRQGNGCLVALGGLGVLLIAAGVGYEQLGGFDWDAIAPAPEPNVRGFTPEGPAPAPPVDEPPPPAVEEPAPVAAPPRESTRLLWLAEVESGPMATGTPCVIAVDVERSLAGPRAVHARVDCGGETRFDAPASGSIEETPEAPGELAYRAAVDGAVTGASLELRTGTHRALVRELGGVLALHVDDLSVPRRGEPFIGVHDGLFAQVTQRLRLRATPTSVTGAAPASVTAAAGGVGGCELTAATVPGGRFSCRVVLRCGTELVYGAGTTGYNDCVAADGAIVTAEDTGTTLENDDPRIALDARAGTLEVSDDDGTSQWSARFALDEDPRCTAVGGWAGAALDTAGTTFAWTMDGAAEGPPWAARIVWSSDRYDGLDEMVTITPDCRSGRFTMTTRAVGDDRLASGTYALWLGPSFRSFAGAWTGEDAVPGVMWGTRR